MNGYRTAARCPFLVPILFKTSNESKTPGYCESTNQMLKNAPTANTGKIVHEKITFLGSVSGMTNQQRMETTAYARMIKKIVILDQ